MRAARFLAAGAVASGLALTACDVGEPQPQPLTPVRVQTVESHELGSSLRYTANIEPYKSVNAAFKVGGYIEKIVQEKGVDGKARDVQTGDRVTSGTVLAVVDQKPYQDKVKEAAGQLGQARAALTKADADYKRAKILFGEQSMTAPEFDSYRKEYQSAVSAVAGAKAQHDLAVTNLSYTKLGSPLGGVVLQRNIEVGALVSPGTVGFVVADVSSVKAVFGVPAVVLGDVKLGSPLDITSESLPNQAFAGKVTSIAAAADTSTRVFDVEVTVPNGKGLLKPGMVASLQVATRGAKAKTLAVVPISAIVRSKTDEDGYAVYVVDGNSSEPKVSLQDIKVGQVLGNEVAVTAGLKPGARVVVYGATLVTDGEQVRVIP
ncbi:MAG: efflux RND transporter periplasmic adaptor subunit [Alphaproteobacteria bacterium]|nr:efflux RND transporter periplasmic adaptor subunit [Alphaproteobacteria bacterium]